MSQEEASSTVNFEVVARVKDEVAFQLEMTHPTAPGKVGAIDWMAAVEAIDSDLQRVLPILNVVTPPQVAAVVALIQAGVHLGNQALHGQPVVNPFNPPQ